MIKYFEAFKDNEEVVVAIGSLENHNGWNAETSLYKCDWISDIEIYKIKWGMGCNTDMLNTMSYEEILEECNNGILDEYIGDEIECIAKISCICSTEKFSVSYHTTSVYQGGDNFSSDMNLIMALYMKISFNHLQEINSFSVPSFSYIDYYGVYHEVKNEEIENILKNLKDKKNG